MKRDENGNYWPEPADLANGCPCCGAALTEHAEEGAKYPGSHECWAYECGAWWYMERGILLYDRDSEDSDTHGPQLIFNIRQSKPAIVREVLEWIAHKYDPLNRAGIFPNTSDSIKALWNRDRPNERIEP